MSSHANETDLFDILRELREIRERELKPIRELLERLIPAPAAEPESEPDKRYRGDPCVRYWMSQGYEINAVGESETDWNVTLLNRAEKLTIIVRVEKEAKP